MTRYHTSFVLAAAAFFTIGGTIASADTGIGTRETSLGMVLTDAKGMTLYTFDRDADGTSSCYEQCAVNWPPLLAAAGAPAQGDFGLVQRTDGTTQWTYDGKPLYLWRNDTAPGDVTGDGFNGVWHAAKAVE